MIDFFIELKYFFSIVFHLKIVSFLTICSRGKIVCVKLGIKFFTKLICPRKECIDFLSRGNEISDMFLTLEGSIETPSLETINPKSLPY